MVDQTADLSHVLVRFGLGFLTIWLATATLTVDVINAALLKAWEWSCERDLSVQVHIGRLVCCEDGLRIPETRYLYSLAFIGQCL
jgi:hypothetical protein